MRYGTTGNRVHHKKSDSARAKQYDTKTEKPIPVVEPHSNEPTEATKSNRRLQDERVDLVAKLVLGFEAAQAEANPDGMEAAIRAMEEAGMKDLARKYRHDMST